MLVKALLGLCLLTKCLQLGAARLARTAATSRTWLVILSRYLSAIMGVGSMSAAQAISLQIQIDAEVESDELAQLRAWLREELLELDVDAVEGLADQAAPEGAKGVASESAGTLIVTLSNSAVLVALAGALRSWLGRGSGRKVTVRLGNDMIEVSGASPEDQQKLIASWLDQHTRDGGQGAS